MSAVSRPHGRRTAARALASLLGATLLLAGTLSPRVWASPWPAVPEVSARAAILIDDATGATLFAKNAHVLLPPASLTKIVTAVVALEHDYLNDPVRVRAEWDELPDSSIMGLGSGEVLTVEELLYGLLLPSGNDAALALARHLAGSDAAFALLMNAKARALGLNDSHFTNSHGLHDEPHFTTAYDIATFARYALRNPTFAKIVATPRITVGGRGVYPLRNTNRLLLTYDGTYGVKTGYTEQALMTLVAAAEREGRRMVVGLLGSPNSFADAEHLLNYGFADYSTLQASGRFTAGGGEPSASPPRQFATWSTPAWPRWWGWGDARWTFEREFALLERRSRAWQPE